MNLCAVAPLLSFVFLIMGGIYLAKKKPRTVFNWIFAFAVFSLAIMEFGNFMVLISSSSGRALFWQRWALAGVGLSPLSWVGLSLIFARENYRTLLKKWIWYLALLFIITSGFFSFLGRESLIKAAELTPGQPRFILGSVGRYFLIFFLLNLVVILINFENTRRFSYGRKRDKIKWTIRGLSIYLWSYIILSSLALLFSYIDPRFTAPGSIGIITGVLLCAWSIYRYGFVDVDVYIGRQAVYTSATITIVGVYLFLVGLITKLIMIWGLELKSFLSFLVAFFVFFIFLCLVFSRNLKDRLRLFIDRALYKGKYDYRDQWAQISKRMSSIFELDKILSTIAGVISEVVGVKRISIMLLNEEIGEFFVVESNDTGGEAKGTGGEAKGAGDGAKSTGGESRGTSGGASGGGASREVKFKKDGEFADWLWRFAEPLLIETFAERSDTRRIYEKEKKNFEILKAEVIVPLVAKQSLIGMLWVGEKPSGEPFTGEDLELLKRVAEQAAIAILNVKLSEELIISREMESFYKVSSFLIHDLKNFASMLSMVAQNAKANFDQPEFREDALDTISHTVARMNGLVQKLSVLPKELELKPRLMDLNHLVMEALARSKIEDAGRIRVVKELNGLPEVMVDSECIEKVVLNLILNAGEAMPDGGNLTISTARIHTNENDGFVEICVKDTGCGMSREFIDRHLFKPFQSTKKKGLGIGLYQCKTIVEAHKGRIDVESRVGEGTTFTIRLPRR